MSTTVLNLKQRDREILLALAQKVRLMALRQVADHWWDGELANTRRRLKALAGAGLVRRVTVSARTLPPIEKPVVTWQPGQSAPPYGKVSYRLQERWARRAVRPTAAYTVTDRAAQLFGGRGGGELKHSLQATHDLGVAAVWLCLHCQAPAWAEAWRGEDQLAHTRVGEKLPDAFIVSDTDEVAWAIEFGGSYDAPRVQDFHEDCARRDLPYQIW
jgi:hypothetical protein